MEFEWNDDKNEANIVKHGFDFQDAWKVLERPHVQFPSSKGNEERFGAMGFIDGFTVVVFYTLRGSKYRIISIRRARRNERERYSQLLQ